MDFDSWWKEKQEIIALLMHGSGGNPDWLKPSFELAWFFGSIEADLARKKIERFKAEIKAEIEAEIEAEAHRNCKE